MNLIKLFICLIILFFSITVSAEFYKYVDENGNTHFTDDFNKVPEDQRAGLKGYEESESTRLQLIKEHEEIKKEREQNIEDRKNAQTSEDAWKVNERIKKLNKRQEELKKKFETFEAERKKYRERLEKAEAKEK